MSGDLRGRQTACSHGTVWQHPLLAIRGAEAAWGRVLHGPVSRTKQLLETLRNVWVVPVFITHCAGRLSEERAGNPTNGLT